MWLQGSQGDDVRRECTDRHTTISERCRCRKVEEGTHHQRNFLPCAACAIRLCVGHLLIQNYFAAVDNFGDSSAYMTLASAIRHWDFHGIVIKQFWGLPYAMAGVTKLTGISDRSALLLFSLVPSLVAAVLAKR